MGLYSGWIEGLSKESGVGGFFRGLIVSAGAIILGLFAAALVATTLGSVFPAGGAVSSIVAMATQLLLRAAFLFYPSCEVARRKALPVPWLWGAAAFAYGFPNGLNSALVVGVVGAWTPPSPEAATDGDDAEPDDQKTAN